MKKSAKKKRGTSARCTTTKKKSGKKCPTGPMPRNNGTAGPFGAEKSGGKRQAVTKISNSFVIVLN